MGWSSLVNGGSWFDENQIPALNSPVALEAMKVYTDLMNWGATPPECVNWEFPELQFAMVAVKQQ